MNTITPEKIKFNNRLIFAYFLFTTFGGALRKWVITSESVNSLIVFIQIFVPIGIVIFLKGIENKVTKSFVTVTYAFLLIGMALNPLNESLMHGLLGFMLHFNFWLLIFLYLDNRDCFAVEDLTKGFFIVCAIELMLGIIQFNLPPSNFLNRYSMNGDVTGIAQVGNYVRVSGSFSYISGFGCFLFFAGAFIWGAFVRQSLPIVLRMALVVFILVCAMMNGSRTITAVSLMFILLTLTEMNVRQKFGVFAITCLVVGIISLFSLSEKVTFVRDAFEAFYGRTTELNKSGEDRMRIFGPFTEVMEFRGEYPVWGVGLGATYQGAVAKWGRSKYVQDYGYYEEEPERIVIEGGFVLFVTRFILFGVILFKTKIPKIYILPIFMFLLFYMPMVFNVFMAAYTFFAIMYLDKVYYLKKQQDALDNPNYSDLNVSLAR